MLDDIDEDVEVAARPALIARLTFAGQADAHTAFDASRDFHLELALLANLPCAATFLTGLLDDLSLAGTPHTGALHREEALLGAHAAMAVTGLAGFRLGAGRCAGAVTACTWHGLGHVNGFFLAGPRFSQSDFQIIAQICTALWPATATSTAKATCAEDLAEQVGEDIVRIAALAERVAPAPTAIFKGGMAKPVIGTTLLSIAQDRIGFAHFLEFLFGFRIPGILVRMILHRQLAVGGLELLLVRILGYAQNLVIVALAHGMAIVFQNCLRSAAHVGDVTGRCKGMSQVAPRNDQAQLGPVWPVGKD